MTREVGGNASSVTPSIQFVSLLNAVGGTNPDFSSGGKECERPAKGVPDSVKMPTQQLSR